MNPSNPPSPVPLTDALGREIVDAVDSQFPAQLDATQHLVRCPSLRGHTHTAADVLRGLYAAKGYAVDAFVVDPEEIRHHPGFSPVAVSYDNALNVVGIHRPQQATGRSLILNGHVDVVPAGPANLWHSPPFEPHLDGDWLYGRGAGDMKAGVIANLFALEALKSIGLQPAATVSLQGVCEEESTGNGTLACLVRGYRADAVLISEPTGLALVRANVGVVWFQIHVKGHPVHVSQGHTGANAIEAAFALVQGLKTLEARWNEERHRHPHHKDLPHPINFNVGKIHGGDWASSVPAWCTLDMRASFYPGTDPKDAMAEIEENLTATAASQPFLANNPPRVTYNGFTTAGYTLTPGSAAEATLGRAHQTATGQPLAERTSTAYLDARVYALYGDCPALVYGPLAENVHGFDERVSLASIQRATAAIALFVAQWCGLEKRPQ